MSAPPTSAPIALFSCAFTGLCPSSTKTGLNRRLHLAAALSSCASTRKALLCATAQRCGSG